MNYEEKIAHVEFVLTKMIKDTKRIRKLSNDLMEHPDLILDIFNISNKFEEILEKLEAK